MQNYDDQEELRTILQRLVEKKEKRRRERVHQAEDLFQTLFPQENKTQRVPAKQKLHCEGDWGSPIAEPSPWPSQEEFEEKLARLEDLAQEGNIPGLEFRRLRGVSESKLDPSEILKRNEYHDLVHNFCWTSSFLPHYVHKFNVRPSREFYEYVMSRE